MPTNSKPNRRRRAPTRAQWQELHTMIGEAWGDGTYCEGYPPEDITKIRRSIKALEDWLETRGIKFQYRIA